MVPNGFLCGNFQVPSSWMLHRDIMPPQTTPFSSQMRRIRDSCGVHSVYSLRPERRINVRKDIVALFDLLETRLGFRFERAGGGKLIPCYADRAELTEVRVEALDGVVRGGFRGDEELPVRGLEQ